MAFDRPVLDTVGKPDAVLRPDPVPRPDPVLRPDPIPRPDPICKPDPAGKRVPDPAAEPAPKGAFSKPLKASKSAVPTLDLQLKVEANVYIGKTIAAPCTAAEWSSAASAYAMRVKTYAHLNQGLPYAQAPLLRAENEVHGESTLTLSLRGDMLIPDHVKFTFCQMHADTDTEVLLSEGSVPLRTLLEQGSAQVVLKNKHNFDPVRTVYTVQGFDERAGAFFRRMLSERRIFRSVLNDSAEMMGALHEVDGRIQALIRGRAEVRADNAGTSMLKSDSFIPGEGQVVLYPLLAVDQEGLRPLPVQFVASMCATALHYAGVHPKTVLARSAAGAYLYSDGALAQLLQVASTMPTRTLDAVYVSDYGAGSEEECAAAAAQEAKDALAGTGRDRPALVRGRHSLAAAAGGASVRTTRERVHESESFELPGSGINFPFAERESSRALSSHVHGAGESVDASFSRYLKDDAGKFFRAKRRLINDDCDGLARHALEVMRGFQAAHSEFCDGKAASDGRNGYTAEHVARLAAHLEAHPYECFADFTAEDRRDLAEVMLRIGACLQSGVFTAGLGVCTTLSPRYDPTTPLSESLGGHCVGLIAVSSRAAAKTGRLGSDTEFIVCEATNSVTMEGLGKSYDDKRKVRLMCNGGTTDIELGECELASCLGDLLRTKTSFAAVDGSVCLYSDAHRPDPGGKGFYQRLFYFAQPMGNGTIAAYAVCEHQGARVVFGGRLDVMADTKRELLPIDLRELVPDDGKRQRLTHFLQQRHVEGGVNPATHQDLESYANAHWLRIPSFERAALLQRRENDFLVGTFCEYVPAPLSVKTPWCAKKASVLDAFNALQSDTPRGDGVQGDVVGLLGALCTQVYFKRGKTPASSGDTGLRADAGTEEAVHFSTASNLERAMEATGYADMLRSMQMAVMRTKGLLVA